MRAVYPDQHGLFGRYRIWGVKENGELHPATGYAFASDNLDEVVSRCEHLRQLHLSDSSRHADYVVCDSENDLVIVYPTGG